jgi:acetoin utilization protein AcuB
VHDLRGSPVKVAAYMSKDPYCIQSDEPLHQAHRLMRGRRVRHLPVLHGQQLLGLVSERDLFLLETLRSVDAAKEPVSEAMTEHPFTVAPDAPVREVVREMREKRYGSVIVLDGGRVAGIFTRSDALRALEECLSPPAAS